MEGTAPPFRHRLRRRHLPPQGRRVLCPPGGGPPERSEGEEGEAQILSNPVPTFTPGKESSQIEAEVDHVAFGDEIVLSLQAPETGIFCPLLPTVLNEIVIGDHLGPNETPLKIGVD